MCNFTCYILCIMCYKKYTDKNRNNESKIKFTTYVQGEAVCSASLQNEFVRWYMSPQINSSQNFRRSISALPGRGLKNVFSCQMCLEGNIMFHGQPFLRELRVEWAQSRQFDVFGDTFLYRLQKWRPEWGLINTLISFLKQTQSVWDLRFFPTLNMRIAVFSELAACGLTNI